MNKLIFTIVSLIILNLSVCSNLRSTTTTPPALTVYVESLCGDSARFASHSFKDLYNNVNRDQLISSVDFIAYGNAVEAEDSVAGNRKFTCQHGPRECYGNNILSCASNHLSKDDSTRFTICLFEKLFNNKEVDLSIATIDCTLGYQLVLTCANSSEGDELHHIDGTKTGVHENNYVPYIIINGEHTKEYQTEGEANITKLLCKYNSLVNVVPGCSEVIELDQ